VICTSCVREKPPESRKACVDIDVAYNQNLKKLDRALIVSGYSFYCSQTRVLIQKLVSVGLRHAEYNPRRRSGMPHASRRTAAKYRHGETDYTQFRANAP